MVSPKMEYAACSPDGSRAPSAMGVTSVSASIAIFGSGFGSSPSLRSVSTDVSGVAGDVSSSGGLLLGLLGLGLIISPGCGPPS